MGGSARSQHHHLRRRHVGLYCEKMWSSCYNGLYTYVPVIKILHFYSYKAFSHNLKFLGCIAHEHTLKVSREKVQLKESILVEFKEFLCRFVDVWWIGGLDLLVSSQF